MSYELRNIHTGQVIAKGLTREMGTRKAVMMNAQVNRIVFLARPETK